MIHNYPYGTELAVNPQLTKKKFSLSLITFFTLIALIKKIDHIIDHALRNTKACEPFFSKFDHCALIFKFPTLKERDSNCSHEVKLKTKFKLNYT